MTRVVTAPPYAFAATATGLDQWDLRSGQRITLGPLAQFAERILDLAYDPRRRALWIVNAEGVARYELATGAVTRLPPPPAGETAAAFLDAVLAPAPGGGVWLGLADGLYFADAEGDWQPTGIAGPIEALHVAAAGDLVVGTRDGLYTIRRGMAAIRTDCPIDRVRIITEAAGGVLAIGESARGEQRIAHLTGDRCEGFRVSPARRLRDAASDGERVLLLTSHGLYQLAPPGSASGVRRLSRDGMTLIPLPGADSRVPLELDPVAADVPAGAQTVAISGREVLVGTVSLGTARLALEDSGKRASREPRWLRRRELAHSAVHLSVVCSGESDCVLANGSGGLWEFDGDRFSRRRQSRSVLGVAEVSGRVLQLTARPADSVLEVLDAFRPGEPPLATTSLPVAAELRLVRGGPGDSLLIGWSEPGAEPGAPLAGMSWLDLSRGRELPVEVEGPVHDLVGCGGRLFAATPEGVREVGAALRPVEGAPVLRLACDRGRLVAATRTRVLREGSGWVEVVELLEPIRDLEVARDGRLYLATAGGVRIWDGVKVRRYDVRRGLIDNDVLEIVLDRFDRIWLRGGTGLGQIRL